MSKEFFYVYSGGLLGVKTNIKDFKWIYGSVAPASLAEEYENCAIQLYVKLVPNKELYACESTSSQFSAFSWNEGNKTLFYRRKLFHSCNLGFNIKFCDDRVEVEIGKSYYKYVKQRFNNLHGMYYLLSDVANIMLLKKGFLTLYASAVYEPKSSMGILCFSPPNTGKTLTAVNLCKDHDCKLLGEDIVITDGEKLFPCPWTCSYRVGKGKDTAGGFRIPSGKMLTIARASEPCNLTHIALLSGGCSNEIKYTTGLNRKIILLNGYLFNYYSSPIMSALAYFSEDYPLVWNDCGAAILDKLVKNSVCTEIEAKDAMAFSEMIYSYIAGEMK